MIKLRKKITNQKGFTLVELMVVVAIIGILAAVVIPKFSTSTAAAQNAKLKADLRTIDGAIMQYYATVLKYPASSADLVPNYIATWPKDASKTTDISYTYTAASGSVPEYYVLKGNDSSGTPHNSPGSKGYVEW